MLSQLNSLSHKRLMGRTLSTMAALRRKAVAISGAPPSISAVADSVDEAVARKSSVLISQVGCTRRVFLINPYLGSQAVEGLAYRIRALTKNDSINSVLIASDGSESLLPSSLEELDYKYLHNESADPEFGPEPGKEFVFARGYDPIQLYTSGDYQDADKVHHLLSSWGDLSLACRGDAVKTKIPVISVPHGTIQDAGFAFLVGSYVMATAESRFRIQNPSRGLSFDPVGLSYMLPRLGQEFKQPAADFPGCGMILGLFGYEADANDMVETGLATNFMESIVSLGGFERTLAELPPWNQQALVKKPIRFYGYPEPTVDHNHAYRNVSVADAVQCFSKHRADGSEVWSNIDDFEMDDPSLDTDPLPWYESRSSSLVDYAATFDEIFRSEKTLYGMLERLREISARATQDPEEQEVVTIATNFVRGLESQSPLALSVIHRLMTLGANKRESLASCIERELKAQANMFMQEDFINWAQAQATRPEDTFRSWKHKSLIDVHDDEVSEIVES